MQRYDFIFNCVAIIKLKVHIISLFLRISPLKKSLFLYFFRLFLPRLEYISYICSVICQYQSFMLDRTQTIEKLKSTRQYLGEHYGVHSMTLFGSQ